MSYCSVYNKVKQFKSSNDSKKLLFVCSPITVWGGGQQYLYRIFDKISNSKDWNVLVIFPDFAESKLFIKELNNIGVNGVCLNSGNFGELLSSIVAFCPDLLHINGLTPKTSSAILIGFLLPHITTCMTSHLEFLSDPIEKKVWEWKQKNIFARIATSYKYHVRLYIKIKFYLSLLQNIIFVNNFFAKKYSRLFKLNNNKIHVIHNGVDVNKFAPNLFDEYEKLEFRKKLGLKRSDFVICGVGGLTQQKRFDVFLEVIARIRREKYNVKGLIIGDGKLKSSLIEMAESLGISEDIVLTGYRDDLPELLNISDCFFMPSDDEGLPYALLEAKACGLPAVATDVGGIPEVIRHLSDGILVKHGDLDGMERWLKYFIDNPESRLKFSKNARTDILERFSLSNMQSNTVKVLQSLL